MQGWMGTRKHRDYTAVQRSGHRRLLTMHTGAHDLAPMLLYRRNMIALETMHLSEYSPSLGQFRNQKNFRNHVDQGPH